MSQLQTPIKDIIRTSGYYLKVLAKAGLVTVGDMLEYVPRAYEDRSTFTTLAQVNLKEVNTLKGTLHDIQKVRTKRGHKLVKARFMDEAGGEAEIVWFNQMHLAALLKENTPMILSGRLKFEYGKLTMLSPKHEYPTSKGNLVHFGKIVPIYPEMDKISTDWFRKNMDKCKPYLKHIKDPLPQDIREEHGFMGKAEAMFQVHFPQSMPELEAARRRLAFEELFLHQMRGVYKKLSLQYAAKDKGCSVALNADRIKELLETLPFSMTDHQKIATFQILQDMEKTVPMQRLLEGDVGSGKTVVAATVAFHTIKEGGGQVAIMAPTEVLANQHFLSLTELLSPFGIVVQQLTGSMTKKQKEEVYMALGAGMIDMIVGTHALIQEGVQFHKLALAVVDEQHRFGVEQRKKLSSHGYPHVLHMTATPIPRTLALTLYGDQDLSIISQMPAGRKEIVTRVVPPHKKQEMYVFCESEIAKGRQVYVICPLIEASENMEDVKAVLDTYEFLQEHIFKNRKVAHLHGKMHAKEKDAIMNSFKDKEIDVLVSTSVIEVGINVPNATVMMIEGSECFGLSQLHQFRGRVGRGQHQSYCFLCTDKSHMTQIDRLRAMEEHSDGFALSKIDMELRGPGEVYGVKQSGLPDLKMADLTDLGLVVQAREAAEALLEKDFALANYESLRQYLLDRVSA